MVVWYFVWAPRKLYRSIHKRIVHSSYDRSAAVLNAIVYLHPNHLRMHSTVYIYIKPSMLWKCCLWSPFDPVVQLWREAWRGLQSSYIYFTLLS